MKPLPEYFILRGKPSGLAKRERSRRQLIAAAIETFSSNGVGETTLRQVAVAAGVTTGTVYNHFRSKPGLIKAVALSIAEAIREHSAPSRAMLKTGAELVAAGCGRYLGLAQSSPAWALLVLDVASVDPTFRKTISDFVLAELKLGLRRKEFSVASEDAALDLVIGASMEGMRRIALGQARPQYSAEIVATILRGLGVAPARAKQVASARVIASDT